MVGVLHTWTRNLAYHPHVYYLVPGGGLHKDHWLPSCTDFFLPVKALSTLSREFSTYPAQVAALFSNPKQGLAAGLGRSLPARWIMDKPLSSISPLTSIVWPSSIAVWSRPFIGAVWKNPRSLFNTAPPIPDHSNALPSLSSSSFPVSCNMSCPKWFVKVRYFGLFAPNRRTTLISLQKLLAKESFPEVEPRLETNSPAPVSSKFLCPICGTPMNFIASLVPCAAPRPVARSP